MDDAERLAAGASGLLRVRPFQPRRIGAVAAETLGGNAADRIRATFSEKVSWFGSTLLEPAFVVPDENALLDSISNLISSGAEVLLVAGMKAMDPLDPCWLALRRFGVTVERFGVPAHPGSLLWIAWHGEIPILGVPTCGLFTQASVFDLILPRILAGERIGRGELAELGHGGFFTQDLRFRFPPYRGVAGAAARWKTNESILRAIGRSPHVYQTKRWTSKRESWHRGRRFTPMPSRRGSIADRGRAIGSWRARWSAVAKREEILAADRPRFEAELKRDFRRMLPSVRATHSRARGGRRVGVADAAPWRADAARRFHVFHLRRRVFRVRECRLSLRGLGSERAMGAEGVRRDSPSRRRG